MSNLVAADVPRRCYSFSDAIGSGSGRAGHYVGLALFAFRPTDPIAVDFALWAEQPHLSGSG